MRYQIVRAYDDQTSATETAENIVAALEAAAIYLRDKSCCSLSIWELDEDIIGEIPFRKVMDYDRP